MFCLFQYGDDGTWAAKKSLGQRELAPSAEENKRALNIIWLWSSWLNEITLQKKNWIPLPQMSPDGLFNTKSREAIICDSAQWCAEWFCQPYRYRSEERSQPSSFIVPIPPFRLILCFRMSDKSEIPFSSVCVMSGIESLEKVIESKNEGRLVMKWTL